MVQYPQLAKFYQYLLLTNVWALNVTGTEGPDTLTGTAEKDSIYGYGGDDMISGLDAGDQIRGGKGMIPSMVTKEMTELEVVVEMI